MRKWIIILIVGAIILGISVFVTIAIINRDNTKNLDMSTQKQLANNMEENENIQIISTLASENVISPKDIIEDNEVYILREYEGYIVVYKVEENGKEVLIKNTGVVTRYLPEADLLELRDGIKLIGRENLNARLEDYE